MSTKPRRIIIGDVHGHYSGLMNLLYAIAPGSDDQVYFLGDLIDRGPQSSQVVDFVRQNSYQCVRGNHEELLLEAFPNGNIHMPAFQSWMYSGGHTTLESYSNTQALLEHLKWIKSLPTYLDLDDIWLVHAGIHPELPIEAQTSQDFCWIRDVFHSSTRPYFPNKLVIVGHTITFTLPNVKPGQLAQGKGWLDIDTGAYNPRSGWLTGLDIDQQQVYQFNVFQHRLRVRPLAEAVSLIEPTQVIARQRKVLQQS
ncbi:MAG: serine/threonine protein phosphatase [Cyanothece sp. SIO1E1]|nr:serine/threonine protein phosphatase [Cyanothece sp. SIO1E1]